MSVGHGLPSAAPLNTAVIAAVSATELTGMMKSGAASVDHYFVIMFTCGKNITYRLNSYLSFTITFWQWLGVVHQ